MTLSEINPQSLLPPSPSGVVAEVKFNLVNLKEDDDGVREEDILIVWSVDSLQSTREKAISAELSEDGGLEVQPVNTVVYTVATDCIVLEGGMVLKAGDHVNGVVVGI